MTQQNKIYQRECNLEAHAAGEMYRIISTHHIY